MKNSNKKLMQDLEAAIKDLKNMHKNRQELLQNTNTKKLHQQDRNSEQRF